MVLNARSTPLNFAGFGDYVVNAGTEFGIKLQIDGSLDSYTDNEIFYDHSGGGTCYGDSGGPAFVQRDGVLYVGGVTARGDADCISWGASTRVDAFESFIQDFLDQSGNEPPPECGRNKDTCTTDDDCCSGDCRDGQCKGN